MISLSGVDVVVETASGPRTLLGDVSLDLAEHRVALVGANGSGKSTLLRLLNGLVLPSQGSVIVEGHDTRTEGALVRRTVGFVFSDPAQQLVMPTPAEDVELSLRRIVPDRRRRASEALRILADRGLGHVAHSSIYDLSGGERQQVAMASVLAVDPRILVADEPTTLLDLRNRNRFRAELADLPQQVICATHDLDFAADFDRVIVIDGGRIAADDTAAGAVRAYRSLVS